MWKMLFITILLFLTMVTSVQGEETSELAEMADFVTDQNIAIKEFQVILKEKMNERMIEEILLDLGGQFSKKRTEDENLVKISFIDTQKTQHLNVLYTVILPKDKFTYPELQVVIEGNGWSEDLKTTLHNEISSISSKYFTADKRIFSWLKTEANDIIENGVFDQKFQEHFGLKHVKIQNDHTSNMKRKYIYGFTNKWNEKIIMDDTPINVQLAITSNKNGHPEMTLGTPILITEY